MIECIKKNELELIIKENVINNLNIIRKRLNIPEIKPLVYKSIEKENIIEFNKIKILLNKLSKKNYDRIKNDFFILLKDVNKDKEIIYKIIDHIFKIASTNKFYSELFSELYSELISVNSLFYDIYNKHKINFLSNVMDIVYDNPTNDYSIFCEYNLKIDKIESTIHFFIKLFKKNIDNFVSIKVIYTKIIDKIFEYINTDINNIDIIIKYLSILSILIEETNLYIKNNNQQETLIKSINEIKNKVINKPILKFKCIHILDLINKN